MKQSIAFHTSDMRGYAPVSQTEDNTLLFGDSDATSFMEMLLNLSFRVKMECY